MNFGSVLGRIVSDTQLHARFLNTLSYLEYIGLRKIVKSQVAGELTLSTLRHASEESRHAVMLKKMALQVGGENFNSYLSTALLCGEAAEAYFQDLDHFTCTQITAEISLKPASSLTYAYVTWLIEERALFVYKSYLEVYQESSIALPLRSLILEEDKHLLEMEGKIAHVDARASERKVWLRQMEQKLFNRLVDHFCAEIARFSKVSQENAAL